jgi:hypothetical protein
MVHPPVRVDLEGTMHPNVRVDLEGTVPPDRHRHQLQLGLRSPPAMRVR